MQNNKVSPAFTGIPTAPTAASDNSSTQVATTAFVQNNKVSPAFSGTPTAPTPDPSDNSTKLATTGFVVTALGPGGLLGSLAQQDSNSVSITGGEITGITPMLIAFGGTGGNTAAAARTNLGLGTLATQNANNIQVTGGQITNIVDLAVIDGGTGASDAAGARTNLGLGSISTQSAANIAITGGSIQLTTALPINSGGTGALTVEGARTNLGLGSFSTQNANAVAITGGAITGITPIEVAFGGTGAANAASARTNLGLGTISIQDASNINVGGGQLYGVLISAANIQANIVATPNVVVTCGSITGITDLLVADGGTGASNAATARINLGAASSATQVIAGSGLAGGGPLSNDVTLTIALTSNGYGTRYVSSNVPSGGQNGDIWYQVANVIVS